MTEAKVVRVLGWFVAFICFLVANLLMSYFGMPILCAIFVDICVIFACYTVNLANFIADDLEDKDDGDQGGNRYAF